MGTPSEDWRAVPIIGFQTIDVNGKDKSMPLFDFPQGYKTAPSLYRSNTQPLNCELCGKMPITTMYYIQNDKEKYTMGVGSECVTHFGEGKSGKQNERSFKIMRAIMLDTDMRNLISTINKNFRKIKDIGYGRKAVEWGGISTPNSADESDFYYGVTQLKKSGDLDILYDPKSRNRDYIRMEYVVSKLPFFDYEGMKRRSDIYSDERIEKDLLSWYSRNEQTATKFFDALSKLFVAGKIDFNASEYPYFNNAKPDDATIIMEDGGTIIDSELEKGIEVEQEHKGTLEEIASGEITVDEAIEKTAEDHLKENPEYYTKLQEIEGNTYENSQQEAKDFYERMRKLEADSLKRKQLERKMAAESALSEQKKPIFASEEFENGGEITSASKNIFDLPNERTNTLDYNID